MDRKKYRAFLLALLALVGFVGVFVIVRGRTKHSGASSADREDHSNLVPMAEREDPSPQTIRHALPRDRPAIRRYRPEVRRALLAAMEQARRMRENQALKERANSAKERGEAESTGLGPKYIQRVIRESLPHLKACYERVLLERPDLAGSVKVEFTIAGEPGVGGLVEEVKVPEESGFPQTFRNCIRESIYALDFDKPELGGRVKVTYPFTFKPSSLGAPK